MDKQILLGLALWVHKNSATKFRKIFFSNFSYTEPFQASLKKNIFTKKGLKTRYVDFLYGLDNYFYQQKNNYKWNIYKVFHQCGHEYGFSYL